MCIRDSTHTHWLSLYLFIYRLSPSADSDFCAVFQMFASDCDLLAVLVKLKMIVNLDQSEVVMVRVHVEQRMHVCFFGVVYGAFVAAEIAARSYRHQRVTELQFRQPETVTYCKPQRFNYVY